MIGTTYEEMQRKKSCFLHSMHNLDSQYKNMITRKRSKQHKLQFQFSENYVIPKYLH